MNLIEALIDLLMGNPIFTVIIFVVITTIIRNIRNAQRGASKPPRNAMPPFGGDVFTGPSAHPMPNREEGRRQEQSVVVEDIYSKPNRPQPAPERAPVRHAPAKKSAETPSFLNAKNAAQGMMWSEVFGPPRALRQHRTRRKP